jgi:hypothetical protein
VQTVLPTLEVVPDGDAVQVFGQVVNRLNTK